MNTPRIGRTIQTLGFLLALAVTAIPSWATSGQDGITVTVNKGAGGQVTLSWTGGFQPYAVFRSTTSVDVTTPASYLGSTGTETFVDTPPAGGPFFYYVEGSCDYNPPELCDGLDNDCDESTPDGSQDPLVAGPCDGADNDLCQEGTNSCFGGALLCSDNTLSSVESCGGNGDDEDCDGEIDEGFIVDSNPPCTNYTLLGTLQGDLGSGSLTASGYSERWYRVNLSESSQSPTPVSASITLYSPPGSDFDLYVRCLGCSGNTGGWSFEHGMGGHIDTTWAQRSDDIERNDSLTILIEIRNYASTTCGHWQLFVSANSGGPYSNCFDSPF